MLEPPPIPHETILGHMREWYALAADTLAFLPLGVDSSTAVYRACDGGADWFVKLRKGAFDPLAVEIPQHIADQGSPAIIAPVKSRAGQLWTRMGEYAMIVSPFIEGKDGYQLALSEQQWVEFGAAIRRIHDTRLPAALHDRLRREVYSPRFREAVKELMVQAETGPFYDEPAAVVAAIMRAHREEIANMLRRAGELADALQARSLPFVLCHADMHAGNLHLTPRGELYIVDWDEPMLSHKERDLGLIGGCGAWHQPQETALFYQGYNRGQEPAPVDPAALAYFRFDRILADISEFGEQLFLSPDGGEDRAQAVVYFSGQFEPECEVELALKGDWGLIKKSHAKPQSFYSCNCSGIK